MIDTAKKAATLSKQTLKDSEIRYRRLFEAAQDGILILDAETGAITDVNPYLIKILGYSREEFITNKLWKMGAFKDIKASKDAFEALQKNKYIRYEDLPLKTKDGRLIQVEFVSNVYLVGNEKVIQCNIRDITEHKRIMAALQENEKIYYDLVNQSPEGVFIIEMSGKILTVNKAMCKQLKFNEEEILSLSIWDIIPEQYLDQYRKSLARILEGKSLGEAAEYVVRGKDGKNHFVEILSAPHYSGKDIVGFQGIARDITKRKLVEKELVVANKELAFQNDEKEKRAAELTIANKELAFQNDEKEKRAAELTIANKELAFQNDEKEKRAAELTIANKELAFQNDEKEKRAAELVVANKELAFQNDEKEKRAAELVVANKELAFQNDEKEKRAAELSILVGNLKRNEELLRETGTLAKVGGSEINLSDMTWNWTEEVFRIHELEPGKMPSVEEGIGYYAPETRPIMQKAVNNAIATGEGWSLELPFITARGKHLWIRSMGKPEMKDGKASRILGVFQDITERKLSEERIQRQLEHLVALRGIDRVISANFDLGLSLSEILTHVMVELGIDAADILILNSSLQMLEYAAERGFRTQAVKKRQVRLGEEYAGRAALERRLIQISNLRDEPNNIFPAALLKDEDFVCYYGVPLIIKGQAKGVLEVFHRAALEPDAEWFDFLNTLAGQAAIAVEIATLFESLQRSNSELFLAYDATIEGWSRALDLRDKETEGHTQRVTEMTENLARAFGLSEAELVQVRWGALLHDIGKMGVLDGILLKPGPLTEEEWVVMKKHPTFAYEMLSPIRYLRLALDIPYCHHEKWDGSGYPRGLKGEQIPLVARIFAIVDVWDALSSDRPYRAAWPAEKVHEHIRTSAGTHFDPQVVDAFMQIPKEASNIL